MLALDVCPELLDFARPRVQHAAGEPCWAAVELELGDGLAAAPRSDAFDAIYVTEVETLWFTVVWRHGAGCWDVMKSTNQMVVNYRCIRTHIRFKKCKNN